MAYLQQVVGYLDARLAANGSELNDHVEGLALL